DGRAVDHVDVGDVDLLGRRQRDGGAVGEVGTGNGDADLIALVARRRAHAGDGGRGAGHREAVGEGAGAVVVGVGDAHGPLTRRGEAEVEGAVDLVHAAGGHLGR